MLPEGLSYWIAYQTLSDMRLVIGGAMQPIQLTEIEAYIRLTQSEDEDEQDDMFGIIRALDRVYLEHHRSERAKEADKRAQEARGGPARSNRPVR